MFGWARSSFIVLAVACAAVTYGACSETRLDPIGGPDSGGGGSSSSGSSGGDPSIDDPSSEGGASSGGKDGSAPKDAGSDSEIVNTDWPCPPAGAGDGGTTFDREWMTGPAPKAEPTAANYGIRTNTVCDKSTLLEWQRVSAADLKTWSEGMAYCDSLSLEGANDWRLPTRIEMLTITDHSRKSPAIDPTAFPSTPTDAAFWSSSIMFDVFNSPNAYLVSFTYGSAFPFTKTDKNRVRCVRGGR